MFERDYLMRLILGYFKTIVLVVRRSDKEKDPEGAAEMLERAIGEAVEIDGDALLSLEPESMTSILEVSGTDPKVIGYVAHGLLLESHYLMLAFDFAKAELRERQARALAVTYGVDLPESPEEAERFLLEAAEQGLIDGGEDELWDDEPDAASTFAAQAKKAQEAAFFTDAEAARRFDPDAPLMQQELHEKGGFGWQGDK